MASNLRLLKRAQPAIGVANADQRAAEPEEGERPQHTAKCCHVEEEDLGDDHADAHQRCVAQPIATPYKPGGEPGPDKGKPAGGVSVPLRLTTFAPSQYRAAEEVADFEGQP